MFALREEKIPPLNEVQIDELATVALHLFLTQLENRGVI